MTDESQLTSGLIYTAAPVVEINGEQNEMVQTLLVSMKMKEAEHSMASLELVFNNTASTEDQGADFAFEYDDMNLLSLGNEVKVFAGDENDPQEIFMGLITAIEFIASEESEPKIAVLAEDALQKARMARHTRSFRDNSFAEIVRTLASEMGATPVIDGLDDDAGPQTQLNETNLGFLSRILTGIDADFQMVGNELHASQMGDVRRTTHTLALGRQLSRVRAVADLAHQVTQVSMSGWDASDGAAFDAASSGNSVSGPGEGSTSSRILEQAMGERPEHLENMAAKDQQEAQTIADAVFDIKARDFVRVDATARGNPGIRVGSHVTLSGLGPRFENTYYVTGACHRYDLFEGYKTDFKAQSGYFGG